MGQRERGREGWGRERDRYSKADRDKKTEKQEDRDTERGARQIITARSGLEIDASAASVRKFPLFLCPAPNPPRPPGSLSVNFPPPHFSPSRQNPFRRCGNSHPSAKPFWFSLPPLSPLPAPPQWSISNLGSPPTPSRLFSPVGQHSAFVEFTLVPVPALENESWQNRFPVLHSRCNSSKKPKIEGGIG